ncbi:protein ETHYLENE-INSENSITIVE 2 isoform X2 [Phoenix dactylifera]|uniref:Protein ETHYLENE-INSENSITIVE 2 isoform X2 n=1 Tax=Phoenix dactylifera TaxID=42345 RepID=A0A8B7BY35_PHODC|nr:protein ETHYLENE-INSENSITIVE 2 isoform X2 [Phoenix dactylifera]
MENMAPGGAVPHFFPSLGPALMISMGYIDLGKWVAAVEGGARFGYDLILLVLFFNFTAILCQYLATCIGMITGKNLAEICREEYCRPACITLGLQAELSMITSDLTMILGVAYGLNLLLGVDLFTCICFATIGAVLLPFFVTVLDNRIAETLYVIIAGLALLLYVLGVLISQPEIPLAMNVIFPKLSGESAYSLMALLGANVMAHNFYIHSSIVQRQRRLPNVSMNALFHDHLFAILFIFTGIFLVNYMLMNSAAVVFSNADIVLNFQDVSLLMDQIFRTPIAPMAFFLVLLFSSQVTTLTRNIGGQVVLQHFFGINLPLPVHHLLVKALTIIPALYCAKSAGTEGMYQLFIFCQVIQAMLLPSSVIPLFRVASSRLIMGAFKLSWYLEILALVTFFGMLASNVIFVIEMLFGNSSWINNMRGSTGSSVLAPYTALLLICCTSIIFTLYLAVTPLKSASDGPEAQIWTLHSQKDKLELPKGREENDLDNITFDEDQGSAVEPVLESSLESVPDKSVLEFNFEMSETAIDSDHDTHQSSYGPDISSTCTSPSHHPEELKSAVEPDLLEITDRVSASGLPNAGIVQRIESKDPVGKDVGLETDVHMDKDNGGGALEAEESLRGTLPTSTSDGPGSFSSVMEKGYDGGNGSGSLSKLSGLGRSARRQLAAILDEFWGNLFDFYGKLTQEASTKKLDILLGLDLKVVGSVKMNNSGAELSKNFFTDADRGAVFSAISRDYSSPKQKKKSSMELPFGLQMGSPSWSQNMQVLNTTRQNSGSNLLDPSEKLCSSWHLPQYSDNWDYQPATIHGYQIASYLKGIGSGRTPYSSSISLEPTPTPRSAASFIPNFRDSVMYTQGQNGLGSMGTSGLQSPTASRIGRLQVERPYYDPSLVESSERFGSSASTKKYHSSPDISALIAASRNSLLNEGKWGGPIAPHPFLGRMTSEKSQYLNCDSRAGVPLPFDELSPPKLYGDVFSSQPNLNPETKSLWSRQPFEQLFGMVSTDQNRGDGGIAHRSSIVPNKDLFSYAESESNLLQSLQYCIRKLLKLEGSDWLFRQNGGSDEELIDRVAATEKFLHDNDRNQVYMSDHHLSADQRSSAVQRSEVANTPHILSLPNCGNSCIWRPALVVSFGVWCIHRILELSLVESRPELWGKYTYVLNRLQGILDPAFSKPRRPISGCLCLERPAKYMKSFNQSQQNGLLCTIEKPVNESFTTASMILEIIKDVEIAISGRKGRTGTAAGDVAFPKGKENLASVLKRYKRRLSNKFPGNHEGTSS